LRITGIINNVFRQKKIGIKLYNAIALPSLFAAVKTGQLKQEIQEE
jgi:hypothetical protein